MIRKLVVSDGSRERELQLVGRLVVGRDPVCDISQDHSLLSRRHAEFVTSGGTVTVRDLGSRNGIFVNGAKAAEQVLEPGDIVQVGPLRARYVVDAGPAAAVVKVDADSTAIQSRDSLVGGLGLDGPAAPLAAPPASPVSPSPRMPSPVLAELEDHDETRLVPRTPEPQPVRPEFLRRSDEADRTWLVSGPAADFAPPSVPPSDERGAGPEEPAAAAGPVDVSAATVLLVQSRSGTSAPPPVSVTSTVAPTVVMPASTDVASQPLAVAPLPLEAPAAAAPAAAAPAPPADAPVTVDERALKGLVLVNVLIAVAIVAAAGAVPFMLLRAALGGVGTSPSLVWLGLPVAAGVAVALVISARLARQIAGVVTRGDTARTLKGTWT